MDDYQTYLLELLVYRQSPGNKEFDDWRKSVKEAYDATAPKAEVPKEANKPKLSTAGPDDPGVKSNLGEKIRKAWQLKEQDG